MNKVVVQVNWSANADPQQQKAASPHGLRSSCLQRWISSDTKLARCRRKGE